MISSVLRQDSAVAKENNLVVLQSERRKSSPVQERPPGRTPGLTAGTPSGTSGIALSSRTSIDVMTLKDVIHVASLVPGCLMSIARKIPGGKTVLPMLVTIGSHFGMAEAQVQPSRDGTNECADAIYELRNSIEAIATTIQAIKQSLDATNSGAARINDKLVSLQNHLSEFEDKFGVVESTLEGLKESFSDVLDDKVSELQNVFGNLWDVLAGLNLKNLQYTALGMSAISTATFTVLLALFIGTLLMLSTLCSKNRGVSSPPLKETIEPARTEQSA